MSLRTQQYDVLLELLRDRREAVGLRQSDLSDRLGQNQATVSRVETGETGLDVIELRDWLQGLGVAFVPVMKALGARLEALSGAGLRRPPFNGSGRP
jgi:transcriptional regulator with XRE-family HTH domain